MRHLTAGQGALLQASLQLRQRQLGHRLTEHHGGVSRAEHAHDMLEQDGDDAPQREGERELDMALSDLETRELGAVSQALARLAAQTYGSCVDCATEIPFDRLKAEPCALRCVACETLQEGKSRRAT